MSKIPHPNAPETKNMVLAFLLAAVILGLWQVYYEMPRQKERAAAEQARQQALQQLANAHPGGADNPAPTTLDGSVSASPTSEAVVPPTLPMPIKSRTDALADRAEVRIDTPLLKGSIALDGARLDNLLLRAYRETLAKDSPAQPLLHPTGTRDVYFASFNWASSDKQIILPTAETRWQVEDNAVLTVDTPVTLYWDNGQGVRFRQKISVDAQYLFTIVATVQNESGREVTLFPYGLVNRAFDPTNQPTGIVHVGPLGVFDGTLTEIDYQDLAEDGDQTFENAKGWQGMTDQYWMTALIPALPEHYTAHFKTYLKDGARRYQVDYLGKARTLATGEATQAVSYFLAGPKEIKMLDAYSEQYSVPLLDRAVDFGVLYFLTKPFLIFLEAIYHLVGNFGVAILIFTICIRLALYPLANKSFVSMSQMRLLQPEMVRLRERYKDDRMKLNEEMMKLYKKHKVNPAAGCLPLLIQLPVFFALYKVLQVAIEMRHAPFFGWIQDLSAPDPTSVFTLLGFIPLQLPAFLTIGVWPILMTITMVLQNKLNPKPADKSQQIVIGMMPYLFLFIAAHFPAGLVIYWTWNNILSMLQQRIIMKRVERKKAKTGSV